MGGDGDEEEEEEERGVWRQLGFGCIKQSDGKFCNEKIESWEPAQAQIGIHAALPQTDQLSFEGEKLLRK